MAFSDKPINNLPVILGRFDGHPVTLCYCNWSRTVHISELLHKITYTIGILVKFAHFNRLEDIIVKNVRVRYPYLSSWYDGWESSSDDQLIDTEKKEIQTIQIKPSLNLMFEDIKVDNKARIRLKYDKLANFEYVDGEKFEASRKDLYKFARLLKLATSKEINFEILSITVSTAYAIDGFPLATKNGDVVCSITTFAYGRYDSKASDWIHQNSMIFSRWKVSSNVLDAAVKSWFETNSFSHIYDYYIDSNTWPKNNIFVITNVMYNNKFLNLIQALEAYHYQLNETYSPDNTAFVLARQRALNMLDNNSREWVKKHLKFPKDFKLQDRLCSLISRHKKVIEYFLGDSKYLQFFPEDAKEFRNKLSHGNLSETYQGDYFQDVLRTAQFLLCLCIMESLRMEDIIIINALRYNYKLADDLFYIKKAYQDKMSGANTI